MIGVALPSEELPLSMALYALPSESPAASSLRRLRVVARTLLGSGAGHKTDLQSLSATLQGGDVFARLEAVRALGAKGAAAAPVSNYICAALEGDEDWGVRAAAAKALGALSVLNVEPASDSAATSKRLELVPAPDSAVESTPVATVLAVALRDSHELVREAAAEALGLAGAATVNETALDALVFALQDDTWVVRAASAKALGRLGNLAAADARYRNSLVAALADKEWQVRCRAAEAISILGPGESSHVVALIAVLSHDSAWRVRHVAAIALGTYVAQSTRAVITRSAAGPITQNDAGTIALCIKGLVVALRADSEWRVQEAAARSLGTAGPTDVGTSAAALASALDADKHVFVRVAATRALGRLGEDALPYAAALAEQLTSGDRIIRAATRDAFRAITGPTASSLVHAAFIAGDIAGNEVVRAATAAELEKWAVAVASHATRLAGALRGTSRQMAEEALAALGLAAAPCMVGHVARSRAGDYRVRMAALRGLAACTDSVGSLPPDLACAFLAEWIYQPDEEALPVTGLTLVSLQRPEAHLGINLQWAVLRGPQGKCFVVFRGSETALDWTENSHVSLRGVEAGSWGVLLLHSGFWSAAEGDGERLGAALAASAATTPIDSLVLCGGSKGGANALAMAVWLLAPRPRRLQLEFGELVVVTFGAPNIVGRGTVGQGSTAALEQLRAALRRAAPRSRSWKFNEDPIPALMSSSSATVISQHLKSRRRALRFIKWLQPQAFDKVSKYLEQAMDVTGTFEAVLPEAWLEPPPALKAKGGHFDAAVHPQVNYSEALCRRLLCPNSSFT